MPDLHSVVRPRVTSALQALSTCRILQVPHEAVRSAAAEHPAIAEALWRDCMVDAAILSKWVLNVGCRSGKSRIAHLLCEMAVRYKAVRQSAETHFKLPMTQTHLGEASGLTPVHVNRMLMALRPDGVDLSRGIVRIRDWDLAVKLADFDPAYLGANDDPHLSPAAA